MDLWTLVWPPLGHLLMVLAVPGSMFLVGLVRYSIAEWRKRRQHHRYVERILDAEWRSWIEHY